jgi:Ca2+-binding RTX toxin-like protein
LSGDAGNDFIAGGAGDDRLEGGEGNDNLAGNDAFIDSPSATMPNVLRGLLVGDERLGLPRLARHGLPPYGSAGRQRHALGRGRK